MRSQIHLSRDLELDYALLSMLMRLTSISVSYAYSSLASSRRSVSCGAARETARERLEKGRAFFRAPFSLRPSKLNAWKRPTAAPSHLI